jgi:hypothetical protein
MSKSSWTTRRPSPIATSKGGGADKEPPKRPGVFLAAAIFGGFERFQIFSRAQVIWNFWR